MMSKRATCLSSDWFKLCWRIIFACLCALYFVLLLLAKKIKIGFRCKEDVLNYFICFTVSHTSYIYLLHALLYSLVFVVNHTKKEANRSRQTNKQASSQANISYNPQYYIACRSAYNIPFTTLLYFFLLTFISTFTFTFTFISHKTYNEVVFIIIVAVYHDHDHNRRRYSSYYNVPFIIIDVGISILAAVIVIAVNAFQDFFK
jgi:hypothetical protein